MPNMSYCRFRNTLSDFRDCAENFFDENISVEEHNARRLLILEMVDALVELGAEVDTADLENDPVLEVRK